MAKRPVFIPFSEGHRLVLEVEIEFKWNPGFAPIQKRKNVAALHKAAAKQNHSPLLEVSTKSNEELGLRLSAFNLPVELDSGMSIPLECAFQGSKIFENGGPYTDIFKKSTRDAKKDERLRTDSKLVGFKFEGIDFPSEPKTAFYDWLYSRALLPNKEYLGKLEDYAGFTDIEFNPSKSINCQARSCALFVSLCHKDLINDAMSSPQKFIKTVSSDSFSQPYSDDIKQGKLF